MTDAQQREAARQFFYKWNGKGKEDEDARSYWIDVLQNIFGIENVTDRVEFEKKVVGSDGNTKRIDVYIPETHVLIEQKSLGIALDKAQPGHDGMTPYEQAKYYDNHLPHSEKARWIVISNFAEIWIYDMEAKKPEPIKLALQDLQTKYHLLDFLGKKEIQKISDEMEVSLQAGEIVGLLYDTFHKQYKNPDDPETLKSLNKLCVRIVFCLYGEDAGIFGKKNMFHDYMEQFDASKARKGLRDLFRVLNQEPDSRDPYLADDDPLLAAFPYVNGGLFDGDDIEIPSFTDDIMELLLTKASDDFDWSGISPTIFGAVFESTLNPETRRSGGMHYTSIENIHKVIDPLFLDDLKNELEEIKKINVIRTRDRKLKAFQDKLASMTFLDPAAGSGNFLTESYTSLRKLENDVLRILSGGQITLGAVYNPIKVSISQFNGIEINDFAVTVARTALWIAENQMMKETEDIVHMTIDFLPLKTSGNIVEGNALRMDWNSVVPKEELDYIMGNPPFVGYDWMNPDQKKDMQDHFGVKTGRLDYVTAWYIRAARLIQDTKIRCAFVSTNSITQGVQVIDLWTPLIEQYHINIGFAYRTFIWDSEASLKAHVHCVIIGFSCVEEKSKYIIAEDEKKLPAGNISPYLIDAPSYIVQKASKVICDVPQLILGSMAKDGGGFIFDQDEYENIVKNEPQSLPYVRRFMMGREFINRIDRYCYWLVDADPQIIAKCPILMKHINTVKEYRESSKAASTRRIAQTPTLFAQIAQPKGDYIVIPAVSSERRRYIPIGYLSSNVIAGHKLFIVPDGSLYHFGVLTSNVHNSWMRLTAGRLKSDYSYNSTTVYNTFPWPKATEKQKETIAITAQKILDVRDKYPNASLATLYNPLTMPPDLVKAHQENDRAVMQAYGMPIKETDEAACVAWLMRMYQELTK